MSKPLTSELERWIYEALQDGRVSLAKRVLRRFCNGESIIETLAVWGEDCSARGDNVMACRFFKLALAVSDQVCISAGEYGAALFAARKLLEILDQVDDSQSLPVLDLTYKIVWRLKKRLHR